MADGTILETPVTQVNLEIYGKQYSVRAGVVEKLPARVVLGCDMPIEELIIRQMSHEAQVKLLKEVLESREDPPVQKEEHGKDQQYVSL